MTLMRKHMGGWAGGAIAVLAIVAGCGFGQNRKTPLPPSIDPGGPGRAPSDAVVLFDGTDVSGWNPAANKRGCKAVEGVMVCETGDGNVSSREQFRDAQIHVEFLIPHMPEQQGQSRGNSGVYLHGRYEVQVLDGYQNPTYGDGTVGALYGQAPPLVVAARPPGEWQSFDILFQAPRCAEGKMKRKGAVTVLHNGVLIQDRVEIDASEKGCKEGPGEKGPLLLQDHNYPGAPHTVMRFRNIWVRHLSHIAD
jgi:hypothetical protein